LKGKSRNDGPISGRTVGRDKEMEEEAGKGKNRMGRKK
jgi:hypothetical protein